jgi:hypothetical protein
MSKTIISFDIGIKNLAFCLFTLDSGATIKVLKWNIVNLIQSDPAHQPSQCTCMKTSKKMCVPCDKKGAFTDSAGKIYCNVHAKNSGKLIPSKEMSMPAIKKMKIEDLKSFCKTHFIGISETDKKPDILVKTQEVIASRSLVPIKVVKQNANHIHLVEIGKQIRAQMDIALDGIDVDIVILENQISPIAGRMNTIQGMLAQYFIMRRATSPKIEFISSSGKLKDYKGATAEQTTYKDHKRDGIAFCRNFMTKNSGLRTHQEVLEMSSKKDDLADCFLQGIYYLKREKLISYSEDLEIKVV